MTKIEWTDTTWNPTVGCTKVSPGCKNCYAERMHARLGKMGQAKYADPFTTVQPWPDSLDQPLHWRKPRRVFVNSMSDLFHEDLHDDYIERVFNVMEQSAEESHYNGRAGHVFQVLTKRPERMRDFVGRWLKSFAEAGVEPRGFDHVWLGVSVEDQPRADERIQLLLQTPAAVRFLSVEPLLGPVDLSMALETFRITDPMLNRDPPPVDWVIVGGESGPGARPMKLEWARSIRDQCAQAGVPFFFKQWGGTNKKAAGRVLDGRTHDAIPTSAATAAIGGTRCSKQ